MRRSVLMTGGLLLVVLLLAGAAFVGGRLLSKQEQDAAAEEMVIAGGDGEATYKSVSLDIQPSDELPAAHPEVAGIFLRREDNSLFLGTGNLSLMVSDAQGEDTPQFKANYDGPEIEVLVTRDTLVYRDDTMQNLAGGPPSGPLQQVLNPGSLDEVGENSAVSAWGERRGDRVVAAVLVYSAPVVMTMP